MFDLLCYKPLNQFGTSLVIIFVPSIARKCRRRKPRKSACHIPRRATNRCSEWGGLGHDGERGRLRVASAIRERRARLGLRLPRVITRWNNEMITFFETLSDSREVSKPISCDTCLFCSILKFYCALLHRTKFSILIRKTSLQR